VRQDGKGTKACLWYQLVLGSGERRVLQFRLHVRPGNAPAFDLIFRQRMEEADEFYSFAPDHLSADAGGCNARRLPACCGASSSIITWCSNGSMATRPSRRLPAASPAAKSGPQQLLEAHL